MIVGDKYFLNVSEISYGSFVYPMKLIGGDKDGLSEDPDFNKDVLEPKKLSLVVGEEGSTTLTLYSIYGKRCNYWNPSVSEIIKVKFTKDEEYCKGSVVRGEKAGFYKITVSCTKKKSR